VGCAAGCLCCVAIISVCNQKAGGGSLDTTQDVAVLHGVTGELPTAVETLVNPAQASQQLQVQQDSSTMFLGSLVVKAL
jgi:hypothetical protein